MPNVTTNLDQLLQAALQHHQAGRLAEAEQLYRQILARQPSHPQAQYNLAVALRGKGQADEAIVAYRRAITLNPNFPEASYDLGNLLCEKGQLREAIAAYRQAIAIRPNYAEAEYNLGIALQASGRLDEAAAAYRQLIAQRPNSPEAHNNLGNILKEMGQLDQAIAAYQQAIALQSKIPEVHHNLGNTLKDKGQLNEAIAALNQAIALRPHFREAHYSLCAALHDNGQIDEAIAAYRRAIALWPDCPEAYNNLGNVLKAKGEFDEAIAAFRQAIALRFSYPEAHNNLGDVLTDSRRLDEAIAACRQAIALRPDYPEAYGNLGNALMGLGQLDEAMAAFRRALALSPRHSAALSNLGNALKEIGKLDEAIAAFRQAIALDPNDPRVHDNLLVALNYHPAFDASAIAEERGRWNHQHAKPLRRFIQPHLNDHTPDRRLRIGYVSTDFWTHASAYFLDPLLRSQDRFGFEIFCYAQVVRPDALTRQFQSLCPNWRSTVGLSDEQVADQIRRDAIDILVDLKLHTDHNRLLVFARKPAPLQVTWLGYPGSTGMEAIDYRLSDSYLDPPESDTSVYSEKTIRLPHTFWCYDPLASEPAVKPLPALAAGHVTFGCLNNFCKVNDQVLQLWARVLLAVDRARLLLLVPEGSARVSVLQAFEQQRVQPNRIEFVPRLDRPQYLELHHRIDLALDTIPYNGHTTSLDALWMGVPVVTLVGQTIVGRAGASQVMNLGLAELIARTPEAYVQIATELANDLPRLAELRSTLRQRMQQSPLMDAPRFALDIEAAYRQMWTEWCRAK